MPDRTCKRCSINRVNTLVAAYHRAFSRNEEAYREKLRKVVQWVKTQGFEARELLSSRIVRTGPEGPLLERLLFPGRRRR